MLIPRRSSRSKDFPSSALIENKTYSSPDDGDDEDENIPDNKTLQTRRSTSLRSNRKRSLGQESSSIKSKRFKSITSPKKLRERNYSNIFPLTSAMERIDHALKMSGRKTLTKKYLQRTISSVDSLDQSSNSESSNLHALSKNQCTRRKNSSNVVREDLEDFQENQEGRYPKRNRRNTNIFKIEVHDSPHTRFKSSRRWSLSSYNDSGKLYSSNHFVDRPRDDNDSTTSISSNAAENEVSSHKKFIKSRSNPRDFAEEEESSPNKIRRGLLGNGKKKRITADAFCSHLIKRCTSNTEEAFSPDFMNDNAEKSFQRRYDKSIINARSELMPINFANKDIMNRSLNSKSQLADIQPMRIDPSIGFDQVGGHACQIKALKESVILPLVYPEIFSEFGIEPPRGLLFFGPPGTGKTLLARALANECSRLLNSKTFINGPRNQLTLANAIGGRQIAFFMRKGADCLSKWVGESERQLRLLFDQAYRLRPSIIFFDEIDGLAPVRSSKQDQIHASIVSTLLSLIDGMDNRGEIVVIGATNRPDCIDPALRRPGRFDREFAFQLPEEPVRERILQIHTSKWIPRPQPELIREIAALSVGYCGADLKALATEAFLCCLRRRYPQIYTSQVKLALKSKYLTVDKLDWQTALDLVRPSAARSQLDANGALHISTLGASSTAQSITIRRPLLHDNIPESCLASTLESIYLRLSRALYRQENISIKESNMNTRFILCHNCWNPQIVTQMVIYGDVPDCLMNALWHKLESIQVFTVNQTILTSMATSSGICPSLILHQVISAAKSLLNNPNSRDSLEERLDDLSIASQKPKPSIVLFLPNLDLVLGRMNPEAQELVLDLLQALGSEMNQGPCSCTPQEAMLGFPRILVVATLKGQLTSTCWVMKLRKHQKNSLKPQSVIMTTRSPSRNRAHLQNGNSGDDPESPINGGLSPSHSLSPIHKNQFVNNLDINESLIVDKLFQRVFSAQTCEVIHLDVPGPKAIHSMFRSLICEETLIKPTQISPSEIKNGEERKNERSRAPTPPPLYMTQNDTTEITNATEISLIEKNLTAKEIETIECEEDHILRQLRSIMRRIVNRLQRERKFQVFARPVTIEEAPDYQEVIKQPMDLSLIREKVDSHEYTTLQPFVEDFELIYINALEYNPDRVARSREIRARAAEFWDTACLYIEEELSENSEIVIQAIQITAAREKREIKNSPMKPNLTPIPMPTGERFSRRLHGVATAHQQLPIINKRSKNTDNINRPELLETQIDQNIEVTEFINKPEIVCESQPITNEEVVLENKNLIGVNMKDLRSFLQDIQSATIAWKFEHLQNLYLELRYRICNVWRTRWDRSQMMPELSKIFHSHLDYQSFS